MDIDVILFDGNCILCHRAVVFILKHEKDTSLRFASLQSKYGQSFLENQKRSKTQFDSVVLLEGNRISEKSDAVLKVCKKLKLPYSWLYYFKILPRSWRDKLYQSIAQNRVQWFGQSNHCVLPSNLSKKRFLN